MHVCAHTRQYSPGRRSQAGAEGSGEDESGPSGSRQSFYPGASLDVEQGNPKTLCQRLNARPGVQDSGFVKII
jgi:hypothetical protein